MIRARAFAFGVSLLAGCAWFRPRTPVISEPLEFNARAELDPPGDSVMLVRTTVRNPGSLTWTLQLGQCSLNIRIAALPPAVHQWSYARWRTKANPQALCVADLVPLRLPPGQSASSPNLERSIRVRDVLGDSLPAGRYRVTVSIEFNNMSTPEIMAGDVELRRRN